LLSRKIIENIIGNNKSILIISKEDLQQQYDAALAVSRKEYRTSSPTKSLCLSLGLALSKQDLQKVRMFLFDSEVQLKVGDRQCVDPKTKLKKAERQKEIRSSSVDIERVNKIKKTISNKSKEELEIIRSRQKDTLTKTLVVKMADSSWQTFQEKCQIKANIARATISEEQQNKNILKWKQVYWSKTEKERFEIQTKRERSSKIGFWSDGIWFGSGFEFNMFCFLTRLNENFVFHGLTCNLNGYTWHPDFYLPYQNLILEVKGAYPKSKNYWFEKTLPKIIEANLMDKYDIFVYWGRKIKVGALEELLLLCEKI